MFEPILWVDLASLMKKEWVEETEKDQTLQLIKDRIIKGWSDKVKDVEETLRSYWNVRLELHVFNELVMRGERIVPPCKLWSKLVELAHEGHLGRSLTKNKLRATYWFPQMDSEVEKVVRDCWACAMSDKSHSTRKVPLSPVNIPVKPWDKLGLDILGPISHLGNKGQYMFVLVDYHSHWTMFKIVSQITTADAIKFLTEAFMREGIPSTLVTDNGVQFTSDNMKEFLKKWGVHHFRTALYNPKANGLVERMNRVMKECIQRARVSGMQSEVALNQMLWSYHTTPNTVTGLSPLQSLKGSQPGTKLNPNCLSGGEHVCEQRDVSAECFRKKQEKYVKWYNNKFGTKNKSWYVGQWVKVRLPRCTQGSDSKFSEPIKIKEVHRNVVRLQEGKVWSMDHIVPHRGRVDRCETGAAVMDNAEHSSGTLRRRESSRTWKAPQWHKDFVLLS
ncbi:hypothetical protein NDU88_000593 [Pleurodeles waltl]|uniref:Gypsy retrotransposon integrase-like protein 1 n=1 Tax=Pleurodeles waltl TaxID=8319 RepID=A0AAV7U5Y2_PLEWA|nr:hypothetical protein NDU88_000593 [Pleurodeles waltl]